MPLHWKRTKTASSSPVVLPCLDATHRAEPGKKLSPNIEEAIRGYIASKRKHGEPLPITEVKEVEVAV